MKKIAVMTGGGDCPGLNAAIGAVVKSALKYNLETLGIRNGWKGLIDVPLKDSSVSGIIPWGGTILGTSRTDPLKDPAYIEKIQKTLRDADIELSAAYEISEKGIPLVGIPKTIDNDIFCTDLAVSFDTAVAVVT